MAGKGDSNKKPDQGSKKTAAPIPKDYEKFLGELKERIRTAQLRASPAVNHELISLYWQIGADIVERRKSHRWGNAVLDRLGEDIQMAFPGLGGFSRTNLYRMGPSIRPTRTLA
jgi:hypothetical protein